METNKWEYKTLHTHITCKEITLNNSGEQGWELISEHINPRNSDMIELSLKKLKIGSKQLILG